MIVFTQSCFPKLALIRLAEADAEFNYTQINIKNSTKKIHN